jgi:hypothetical protein
MVNQSKLIWGILFFTIGLFLMVNQAMAFSNEPCSKFNYKYCNEPAMSATNGSWSITLNDIVPTAIPGKWEWKYSIRSGAGGNFTGSNFVGFLIPDCCKTAEPDERIVIEETASDPDIKCFTVGEGETVLNFGRYNNQAFVCKGTPDSTGNWTIIANTQYKTTSTIIIKSGKDVIGFEMAVPGCPLAPAPTEPLVGARTFSECSNFGQETLEPIIIPGQDPLPATADDISFYVVRSSDRDGCISTLWRCIGHDCPGCNTADGCNESNDPTVGCQQITAEDLTDNYVLETSFLRTCPDENISVTHGSPFYTYKTYSGGLLYQSCLDLRSYKWVSLNCCYFPGCP